MTQQWISSMKRILNWLSRRFSCPERHGQLSAQVLVELVDIAPAAMMVVDFNGKILYANQTAFTMHGYSEEEFMALHLHDLDVPEDAALIDARIKMISATGTGSFKLAHYRKDRTVLPIQAFVKLAKWGGKEVLFCVDTDISVRQRADELVSNILETVDEGFIIIDRDFRIISANRAYAEKVKRPVEEILGKHCYEVSHQFSKPCYEGEGHPCTVHHVFETGEPAIAEHTHYDKAGNPVYVETKAYPLAKDADGKVLTAIEIVIDITEKRDLEGQLRQAHKMEAVGQLAGGIAHDFNNILTTIIGYAGMLAKALDQDDPNRHMAQMVLESGERAATLTKSLLSFSREQPLALTVVDVNGIIRKVEQLLRRVIGEDIEFRVHTAELELTALADAVQIEQVLMNLATNARDAMPKGGTLTISAEPVQLDRQFLEAHGYGKPGSYALITVNDTGAGMAKETQLRIFEPFFTTKELGKGTGLGLSIVYGIIKQHQGFINVYSEPGLGTTFRVYLPLTRKLAAPTMAAECAKTTAGCETILVAEDEESVRRFSKIVLEKSGYKVIEAVDGEDAVNKFMAHQAEIDLLLLDMVMPKMDGKKVYERIKEIRPAVKALFTSGYSRELISKRFALDEDLEFIYKPVSPTALLKQVRELLDKGKA